MNKPILEQTYYKSTVPKGNHTVKVWQSEQQPDKFSFSCAFGAGVMSACSEYSEDSYGQFGQFDTPEEALEAGRKVIFS